MNDTATLQPMPKAKFTTLGVKCESLIWSSNPDNSTTYMIRAAGRNAGYITIHDGGKVVGTDLDENIKFTGATPKSPMNGARFIALQAID